MENSQSGKRQTDKDKSNSRAKTEHRSELPPFRNGSLAALKSGECEYKSNSELLLDSQREPNKCYIPLEALDICDGLRPCGSRSRTVVLLPAIEESILEDKLAQEIECTTSLQPLASTSIPNLQVRHAILTRVSSKPTLTSISEELIPRDCESVREEGNTHTARTEDVRLSMSETTGEGKKSTPGRIRRRNVNEKAIVTNLLRDIGNDTSVIDDSGQKSGIALEDLNQPHCTLQMAAAGEGVVTRLDEVNEVFQFFPRAGDEGVSISLDKHHEVNVFTSKCTGEEATDGSEHMLSGETWPNDHQDRTSERHEYSVLRLPCGGDIYLLEGDEKIRFLSMTDNSAKSYADSFLSDLSAHNDHLSQRTAIQSSRIEDLCGSENIIKIICSAEILNTFKFNADSNLEDVTPMETTETSEIPACTSTIVNRLSQFDGAGCVLSTGCHDSYPLVEVDLARHARQTDSSQQLLFCSREEKEGDPDLNKYIKRIVLGSLCEVIVQHALRGAIHKLESAETPGQAVELFELAYQADNIKRGPSTSMPRGSGSDSVVADAILSCVDLTTAREAHSEHTMMSASSDKQDKDLKDIVKTRDKDTSSKQRGRERERNKRKRDREQRSYSGKKLLKNAVGDVKRSEAQACREKKSDAQPRNATQVSAVTNQKPQKIEDIDFHTDTITYRKVNFKNSEILNRTDDSGDVLEVSVKSSCALEHQTVANLTTAHSSSEHRHQAHSHLSRRDIFSLPQEDDKCIDDAIGAEALKSSASRYGKRTSCHRLKNYVSVNIATIPGVDSGISSISSDVHDTKEIAEVDSNIRSKMCLLSLESTLRDKNIHNRILTTDICFHFDNPCHRGAQIIPLERLNLPASHSPRIVRTGTVCDESFNHPPKYLIDNPSGSRDRLSSSSDGISSKNNGGRNVDIVASNAAEDIPDTGYATGSKIHQLEHTDLVTEMCIKLKNATTQPVDTVTNILFADVCRQAIDVELSTLQSVACPNPNSIYRDITETHGNIHRTDAPQDTANFQLWKNLEKPKGVGGNVPDAEDVRRQLIKDNCVPNLEQTEQSSVNWGVSSANGTEQLLVNNKDSATKIHEDINELPEVNYFKINKHSATLLAINELPAAHKLNIKKHLETKDFETHVAAETRDLDVTKMSEKIELDKNEVIDTHEFDENELLETNDFEIKFTLETRNSDKNVMAETSHLNSIGICLSKEMKDDIPGIKVVREQCEMSDELCTTQYSDLGGLNMSQREGKEHDVTLCQEHEVTEEWMCVRMEKVDGFVQERGFAGECETTGQRDLNLPERKSNLHKTYQLHETLYPKDLKSNQYIGAKTLEMGGLLNIQEIKLDPALDMQNVELYKGTQSVELYELLYRPERGHNNMLVVNSIVTSELSSRQNICSNELSDKRKIDDIAPPSKHNIDMYELSEIQGTASRELSDSQDLDSNELLERQDGTNELPGSQNIVSNERSVGVASNDLSVRQCVASNDLSVRQCVASNDLSDRQEDVSSELSDSDDETSNECSNRQDRASSEISGGNHESSNEISHRQNKGKGSELSHKQAESSYELSIRHDISTYVLSEEQYEDSYELSSGQDDSKVLLSEQEIASTGLSQRQDTKPGIYNDGHRVVRNEMQKRSNLGSDKSIKKHDMDSSQLSDDIVSSELSDRQENVATDMSTDIFSNKLSNRQEGSSDELLNTQDDGSNELSDVSADISNQLSHKCNDGDNKVTNKHNSVYNEFSNKQNDDSNAVSDSHNDGSNDTSDSHDYDSNEVSLRHHTNSNEISYRQNGSCNEMLHIRQESGNELPNKHILLRDILIDEQDEVTNELSNEHDNVSNELSNRHFDVSNELSKRQTNVSNELSSRHSDVSNELSNRKRDVSNELLNRQNGVSNELSNRQGDVSNALSTRHGDVSNELSNRHGDVSNELSNKQSDVSNELSNRSGDVSNEISDTQGDLSNGLYNIQGDVSNELSNRHGDVSNEISDTHGDVSNELSNTHGDVSNELSNTHGDISNELSNTHGDVSHELSNTQGDVSNELSNTQGDASNELSNIQGDDNLTHKLPEKQNGNSIELSEIQHGESNEMLERKDGVSNDVSYKMHFIIPVKRKSAKIDDFVKSPDLDMNKRTEENNLERNELSQPKDCTVCGKSERKQVKIDEQQAQEKILKDTISNRHNIEIYEMPRKQVLDKSEDLEQNNLCIEDVPTNNVLKIDEVSVKQDITFYEMSGKQYLEINEVSDKQIGINKVLNKQDLDINEILAGTYLKIDALKVKDLEIDEALNRNDLGIHEVTKTIVLKTGEMSGKQGVDIEEVSGKQDLQIEEGAVKQDIQIEEVSGEQDLETDEVSRKQDIQIEEVLNVKMLENNVTEKQYFDMHEMSIKQAMEIAQVSGKRDNASYKKDPEAKRVSVKSGREMNEVSEGKDFYMSGRKDLDTDEVSETNKLEIDGVSEKKDIEKYEILNGKDDRWLEIDELLQENEREIDKVSEDNELELNEMSEGMVLEIDEVSKGKGFDFYELTGGQTLEIDTLTEAIDMEISEVSDGRNIEIDKVSEGNEQQIYNVSGGKEPEIDEVSDRKELEIDEVSDRKELEIDEVSDRKELEIDEVSDRKELEIDEVSDRKEPEIDEVSDRKKPEIDEVSEGKELEIDEVSGGKELEIDEVSGRKESEIGEVAEGKELEIDEVAEGKELEIDEVAEGKELEIDEVAEGKELEIDEVSGEKELEIDEVSDRKELEIDEVSDRKELEIEVGPEENELQIDAAPEGNKLQTDEVATGKKLTIKEMSTGKRAKIDDVSNGKRAQIDEVSEITYVKINDEPGGRDVETAELSKGNKMRIKEVSEENVKHVDYVSEEKELWIDEVTEEKELEIDELLEKEQDQGGDGLSERKKPETDELSERKELEIEDLSERTELYIDEESYEKELEMYEVSKEKEVEIDQELDRNEVWIKEMPEGNTSERDDVSEERKLEIGKLSGKKNVWIDDVLSGEGKELELDEVSDGKEIKMRELLARMRLGIDDISENGKEPEIDEVSEKRELSIEELLERMQLSIDTASQGEKMETNEVSNVKHMKIQTASKRQNLKVNEMSEMEDLEIYQLSEKQDLEIDLQDFDLDDVADEKSFDLDESEELNRYKLPKTTDLNVMQNELTLNELIDTTELGSNNVVDIQEVNEDFETKWDKRTSKTANMLRENQLELIKKQRADKLERSELRKLYDIGINNTTFAETAEQQKRENIIEINVLPYKVESVEILTLMKDSALFKKKEPEISIQETEIGNNTLELEIIPDTGRSKKEIGSLSDEDSLKLNGISDNIEEGERLVHEISDLYIVQEMEMFQMNNDILPKEDDICCDSRSDIDDKGKEAFSFISELKPELSLLPNVKCALMSGSCLKHNWMKDVTERKKGKVMETKDKVKEDHFKENTASERYMMELEVHHDVTLGPNSRLDSSQVDINIASLQPNGRAKIDVSQVDTHIDQSLPDYREAIGVSQVNIQMGYLEEDPIEAIDKRHLDTDLDHLQQSDRAKIDVSQVEAQIGSSPQNYVNNVALGGNNVLSDLNRLEKGFIIKAKKQNVYTAILTNDLDIDKLQEENIDELEKEKVGTLEVNELYICIGNETFVNEFDDGKKEPDVGEFNGHIIKELNVSELDDGRAEELKASELEVNKVKDSNVSKLKIDIVENSNNKQIIMTIDDGSLKFQKEAVQIKHNGSEYEALDLPEISTLKDSNFAIDQSERIQSTRSDKRDKFDDQNLKPEKDLNVFSGSIPDTFRVPMGMLRLADLEFISNISSTSDSMPTAKRGDTFYQYKVHETVNWDNRLTLGDNVSTPVNIDACRNAHRIDAVSVRDGNIRNIENADETGPKQKEIILDNESDMLTLSPEYMSTLRQAASMADSPLKEHIISIVSTGNSQSKDRDLDLLQIQSAKMFDLAITTTSSQDERNDLANINPTNMLAVTGERDTKVGIHTLASEVKTENQLVAEQGLRDFNTDNGLGTAVCSTTSPCLSDSCWPQTFNSDDEVEILHQEEPSISLKGVCSDNISLIKKKKLAVTKSTEIHNFDDTAFMNQIKQKEVFDIGRELICHRHREKSNNTYSYLYGSSVTKSISGTVFIKNERSIPGQTRSFVNTCDQLKTLGELKEAHGHGHFYDLRHISSSPIVHTEIRRIKLVDVELFPKEVPSIYHPESCNYVVSGPSSQTRHLLPDADFYMRPCEIQREKKFTLWRRFKSIMRPSRLLRRDGKFRFVKKYKQVESYHAPITTEKSPHHLNGVSGGLLKSEEASSFHRLLHQKDCETNICQDPAVRDHALAAWHRPEPISDPAMLKNKCSTSRSQHRRFSRLRVLRHSVEKMGNRFPAVKRHNVSHKNYLRVNDLKTKGVGDESSKKSQERTGRSFRKQEFSLLEHPLEMAASHRCQMIHSAIPEVMEVLCDQETDLSKDRANYKGETTVRLLMKPAGRKSSTNDSSEGINDPEVTRGLEFLPTPAQVVKRPASGKHWPCHVM